MNEALTPPADDISAAAPRSLRLNLVWAVVRRPASSMSWIASQPGPLWLTPLLILSLTGLALVGVSGPIKAQAAAMGQINLPPGFEYYSPAQQDQFLQAQSVATGPAFLYFLPGLSLLMQVWIGWLIASGLLHLTLTLLGSRSTTQTVLNFTAWAALPFAGRDLVRVAAVLIGDRLIQSPGLSGLVEGSGGVSMLWLAQVLRHVDLYLIWHIFLLVLAVRSDGAQGKRRAWAAVLLTQAVLLTLQALPPVLLSRLGDTTIIRPFMF
jgi:hypothetical protein